MVRLWLAVVFILVLIIASLAYERLPGEREYGVFDTNPPTPYFHYPPTGVPRGRVLAIHGLNASKSVLNILAHALSDAGFEVFTIDLPGHGDSIAPFNVFDARDVIQQVLDRLGPDTKVIGHSMGGALLLDLMNERHAGEMVLFSPAPVLMDSINADRLMVLVSQFDPPLLRLFGARLRWYQAGTFDLRDLTWTGHSGGYFRPWVIEEVAKWLGGRVWQSHTVLRYFLLAVVSACGLSAGILMLSHAQRADANEKARQPAHISILQYIVAGLLAAMLLAFVNVAGWIRLFTTDYLVGYIALTGIVLMLVSRPQLRISHRSLLIAAASATYLIVLLNWPGSELAHTSMTASRWWRFPILIALGLPQFIADESMLRPIQSGRRRAGFALITRLLLASIAVTGVLIFNRKSGFLLLIAPLIVVTWMLLWFGGELVRRRTDSLGTALFAALIQAWMFSTLFVAV